MHVPFGDLAHLIADALWPATGDDDDRMAYGAARVNLDGELAQAVKTGTLSVRDPLTFGPHTFPIGAALKRALVSVNDLREFVAGRGLSILFQFTDCEAGVTSTSNMTQAEHEKVLQERLKRHAKGYYTMSEVAQILGDSYNLDATALLKTMKSDYYAGHLTIRSRATDAPVLENHTLRDFYDWMFPDDIRAMLARWKWNREFPFSAQEAGPAQTATPAPMGKVVFSAPPSLISISASGLRMFDGDGYNQYLSDKAERNAKGRYTMAEAAQVLADAHGLNPANFLQHRMMPAFDSDTLRVIDPTDGGPVRGRKCNAYFDEVTPSGVDAWLEAEGFADHVRWPVVSPMPPKEMPTAAEPIEVKPQAPATGPKLSTNKAALIAQHEHEWPTIRRDLQDASTNGLSDAAKAGVRDWNEDAAMQWARSKNKLNQAKPVNTLAAVMSSLPSTKHRIQG